MPIDRPYRIHVSTLDGRRQGSKGARRKSAGDRRYIHLDRNRSYYKTFDYRYIGTTTVNRYTDRETVSRFTTFQPYCAWKEGPGKTSTTRFLSRRAGGHGCGVRHGGPPQRRRRAKSRAIRSPRRPAVPSIPLPHAPPAQIPRARRMKTAAPVVAAPSSRRRRTGVRARHRVGQPLHRARRARRPRRPAVPPTPPLPLL